MYGIIVEEKDNNVRPDNLYPYGNYNIERIIRSVSTNTPSKKSPYADELKPFAAPAICIFYIFSFCISYVI